MTVRKFVDYDNEAYIWEKTKNTFQQKEAGKGLSEANYTQTEKTKLAGITAGAEPNVNADWDASTGDAAILHKPTIPTVTDTYSGTSSDAMSGKAVKSAIDALDANVTGTAGAGKTLTVFGQTDGVVSATFGDITITKSQVSDFPVVPVVDTTVSGSSNNAIANSAIKSYVDDAVGAITGISFEIVQTLPQTGDAGTIYLVPNSGSGTDVYDEYVYISNSWEKIGSTDVDLSNYMTFDDMVPLTTAEIDAICI